MHKKTLSKYRKIIKIKTPSPKLEPFLELEPFLVPKEDNNRTNYDNKTNKEKE